jgi:hypothetical protein
VRDLRSRGIYRSLVFAVSEFRGFQGQRSAYTRRPEQQRASRGEVLEDHVVADLYIVGDQRIAVFVGVGKPGTAAVKLAGDVRAG